MCVKITVTPHPVLPSPSSWSWVKTGNINWTTNDKATAALPAANARKLNSDPLFTASLVPIPIYSQLLVHWQVMQFKIIHFNV